jgi:hypothetical protein
MAAGILCVGAGSAQASTNHLTPRMSQAKAMKLAAKATNQQMAARRKLEFHPATLRDTVVLTLSWGYACNQYANLYAALYEGYRWYVNSGGARTLVYRPVYDVRDDGSFQRANTWWRCRVDTFPVNGNTTLAPVALRIEVAGHDESVTGNYFEGISGAAVACEALYQNGVLLATTPNGCSLAV